MSYEYVSKEEMCKISICTNKALENGYCEQHQEFVGRVEENEKAKSTEQQISTSWQTFLFWMAGIIFVGGAIYGVYNYDLIDSMGFSELDDAVNAAKARALLVPIFTTGSVSIILLALSQIIVLLEKINKK